MYRYRRFDFFPYFYFFHLFSCRLIY